MQNEFSLEENIALARQFVSEQLVSRGMIADFAIHMPDKEIQNPHLHILCPIRPLKENGKYPYFSQELEAIVNNLFVPMGNLMTINTAAFGEIFVIINQLIKKPINMRFWSDIHPDIAHVSKALYCDGHFGVAAEKAMVEIETKMRSLFKECKPNTGIPKDAAGLIDALLSENGRYSFCDISERSGQNYRKGIHELFKGAFLAFRNPNVHENIECTQKEAFERITLAS